jgi:hypothetical protein
MKRFERGYEATFDLPQEITPGIPWGLPIRSGRRIGDVGVQLRVAGQLRRRAAV